ncbi:MULTISPECIES: ATP-binding protein [Streptosporangium]|uniref:histidine kinase n=1 Tax=Streptosporangium brasiliense TaxID=47480 RepID=A0ABT9R970_9ACTN|nr:histidine kinase [Streptosporangium brasiliense]MDP9865794.1 signal transduction histidine kinase [Streptosporangium brasiliense]
MLIALGCAVLLTVLYALAVYGTAGPAAIGAVAAAPAVTLVAVMHGGSLQDSVGAGGLTAGGAAMAWATGRSHRRRRADRAALAAYRAAAEAVPRLAAITERDRLAAELHDVAAHRLTGIVVASAAALRLDDPVRAAEAVTHAADAGRQAVAELDRLCALDRRGRALALGDIDTLLVGRPGVTYHRTVATAPPELAAVAFRVVREALTNAMRYATGAAVHVRVEAVHDISATPAATGSVPAPATGPGIASVVAGPPAAEAATGRLVVTVTDDGGPATVSGLGTGTGLATLRRAVGALGGTLHAGPRLDPGSSPDSDPRTGRCPGPVSGPRTGRSAGPLPHRAPPYGPASAPETARTPPPPRGWTVQARLPLTAAPSPSPALGRPRPFPLLRHDDSRRDAHRHGRAAGWRGTAALDWALVVLAVALPAGAGLLHAEAPEPFATPASGALLSVLLVLHALPLRWRRELPWPSLAAAQSVLSAWLWCDAAGWTAPESAQLVLLCWWVELTLIYSVGAYGGRGWPAPLAVAALGAYPLVDGLTGPPVAVWATLTAALAVPTVAVWAAGVSVGGRRRRLRDAAALERDRLDRDAAAAARAERDRIAAGLRRTARSRAESAVRAADERRLDTVLTEARAGLTALRELLGELRDDPADDALPPVIAAISALAARSHAAVRYTGTRRPMPATVEVAAYRIAEAMLPGGVNGMSGTSGVNGVTVTVAYLPDGLALSGPAEARKVRATADAAGGTVTETEDGVRVWLPEVRPA